jgi:CheY-like chemotaxis protein
MHKHARILVIDDDPLFRSLIVSLLRKDYMVAVASDGLEGFHKALEIPPDIAIVDIQMTGWDGLRTLDAFRKHPSLADVKIVMLTADATRETVLAAIQGCANDYVIKSSFSKEAFLEKVARFAQQANSAKPPAPHLPISLSDSPTSVPAMSVPATVTTPPPGDESLLQDMMDDWE